MRRRGLGCALELAIVLCAGLGGSRVAAQDRIAEARAAEEEARFEDAERLYTEAAAAQQGLSRDDVIRILQGRASVRAAVRDTAGARADVRALLCLEPSASFGEEAAPSLRRLVDEVRSEAVALGVEVEASVVPEGFLVVSHVVGSAGDLVRAVQVHELTTAGARTHSGTRVMIPGEGELRYTVEIVGWGGAILASAGSPAEPRVLRRDSAGIASPAREGGDDALWIGLGVGAGVVLVVVAVVLGVTLSPSGRTQLGGPIEVPAP